MQLVLFNPYHLTYQMLPFRARVDPGARAIKESSAFPIIGTSPSDCLVSYPGHSLVGVTPLQRSSRYILQPQPTGQYTVKYQNSFISDNSV